MTDFFDLGEATGLEDDEIAAAIMKSSPQRNGVVIFGDSITYLNMYPNTATSDIWSSRGFFTTANFMLGWPFKLLNNAGVSGNNTTQMLTRIQEDVISYKPKFCSVWGGVNDFIQDFDVSLSVSNMTTILATLKANGIQPLCATVPIVDGMSDESKPQEFNEWLKYYCNENNIPLVDCAAVYSDIDNDVAPYQISDISDDEVHPNRKGGYLLGTACSEKWDALAKTKDSWVTRNDSNGNLFGNSLNTGTSGSVEVGDAPDGFAWWKNPQAEATFTGSTVNKGSYYNFLVTLTNTGTTGAYCKSSESITETITEDGSYVFSSEFGFVGVDVAIAQCKLTINVDGVAAKSITLFSRDFEQTTDVYDVSGSFVSDPIALTAGVITASIAWEFEAVTGVMTIGRHQVMKVTGL